MAEQTFVARIKDSDPKTFALITADFASSQLMKRIAFATEEELRESLTAMPENEFQSLLEHARKNEVR